VSGLRRWKKYLAAVSATFHSHKRSFVTVLVKNYNRLESPSFSETTTCNRFKHTFQPFNIIGDGEAYIVLDAIQRVLPGGFP
jgi:hypothetical protein